MLAVQVQPVPLVSASRPTPVCPPMSIVRATEPVLWTSLSVAVISVSSVTIIWFGSFSISSAVPISTVCSATSSSSGAKSVMMPLTPKGTPESTSPVSAKATVGSIVNTTQNARNKDSVLLARCVLILSFLLIIILVLCCIAVGEKHL